MAKATRWSNLPAAELLAAGTTCTNWAAGLRAGVGAAAGLGGAATSGGVGVAVAVVRVLVGVLVGSLELLRLGLGEGLAG